MKDKFPIVEVEWIDASHYADHTLGLDDAKGMSGASVRTVGYLLKGDEGKIVLAMTHFYDIELPKENIAVEGGFRLIWVIPKGCIKSIKLLRKNGIRGD